MSYEFLKEDTVRFICASLVCNEYEYIGSHKFTINGKEVVLKSEQLYNELNSATTYYYVVIDNVRYNTYSTDWHKILKLNKDNSPNQAKRIFGDISEFL